MSSAASRSELQGQVLEARDRRQRELEAALGLAREGGFLSVLFASTNTPGPNKVRPGFARLIQAGGRSLACLGLHSHRSGSDVLGPYSLALLKTAPEAAKRAAIGHEESHEAFRLLDLDIYSCDGSQLDRAALGLAPRPCLACDAPARECIRLGLHDADLLAARVDALLDFRLEGRFDPARLPEALALGALDELRLTPKPGLVDLRDAGSHPDLSFETMRCSAELLPQYFDELERCMAHGGALADTIRCGQAAERRMFQAIGSNAHKGYIFLSGLALLAARACGGDLTRLPASIAASATSFFARPGPAPSRGSDEGIRAEAERGLPAVFAHGWPAYREALAMGWTRNEAGFYLMAILMQRLEDTTALRRCGDAGLKLLREDGRRLQRLLEARCEATPWLLERNDHYRRMRLTMGGVADCMALTFALERASTP